MKLQYKPIEKGVISSLYVERIFRPYVEGNWHFHKEYELIYFLKGQGMRIVGDHLSNFQQGELVLVGEWLPHLWRNETGISGEADADFILVKFPRLFENVPIFSLPEFFGIRNLLKRSMRGLLFAESMLPKVHDALIHLSESQAAEKMISFLRVLQILAEEEEYEYLTSPDFSIHNQDLGENRLQKVINHISTHYHQSITLEEIARIAHMTPPAFCRFFKSSTNKTFSYFLNEVRVSKACQLLINGEKSISQICFDVGFNSLTNFNRTFRSFKGTNPSKFRASYNEFRK
jgi:AraC-like DNA-binding protein